MLFEGLSLYDSHLIDLVCKLYLMHFLHQLLDHFFEDQLFLDEHVLVRIVFRLQVSYNVAELLLGKLEIG